VKIIWFLEKQFDTSLDIATWIEMIGNLQENNDVFLITGFRKRKIQFDSLKNKIIYLKSLPIPFVKRAIFYFQQLKHFRKIIEKKRPDVLLFNTMNYFVLNLAVRLQKKYSYRLFLDIRTISVYSSFIYSKIEEFSFKKCIKFAAANFEGISYITEEIKEYCQTKYSLTKHNSLVWNSSVNTDVFKPKEKKLNLNHFNLIYHGTITENRQIGNLIRAVSEINDIDLKLVLLGEGKGIGRLKELSAKLELGDRIQFVPPVSYHKVPEFINNADVGIIPFENRLVWNTSSPIKLFEYLACEKPVIVTRIPAFMNLLKGQDFVFWAKTAEPEDIADSIRKSYDSRDKFNAIRKNARDFICENYTWGIQAKKLERFITG